MRNILLSACAVFTLAACQSEAVREFDETAIDNILQGAVDSGEVIGISALVYDEGEVVYQNAFGLRDRERGDPVEFDSVFRIFSMTKPITSALIMDLVEEGKLKLDDPAAKYIPELAQMKVAVVGEDGSVTYEDQARPMTIEDLLLHRAGIGYGIFGPISPVEAAYEKAELFAPDEDLSQKMIKLSQLPLIAQPGEGWYYSYSIDVLGRIAEVVTGDSFSDLLQTRIFDPLGMSDTGFYVRPDQKDRFASNYMITETGDFVLQDDGQTSGYLNDFAFKSGGGGLLSTLLDYRRFAQMILQEGELDGVRILEPHSVRTMLSNQMDPDDQYFTEWIGPQKQAAFGYGGSVITGTSEEALAKRGISEGQWGWSGMANTRFVIDPKNDAFSIIMLQFFSAQDPDIRERFLAEVTRQVAD